MDTIEDTASDWLDHLRVERGASAHTVSNYRRDIRRYAHDLGARGITDIAGVRSADIEAHLASLASGGLTGAPAAPASVARASAAIRGLHAYALRQGRVGADAAAEVRAPKQGSHLPKALSVDQVGRLLDAARAAPGAAGLRDAALLELLYATGARVSEAVGLAVDDIDLDDEAPVVRLFGKGRKERLVPLGSYAKDALGAYLVRGRPELAARGRGSHAVFLNKRGAAMSRQSAWEAIRRAASAAGLEAGVSPHTLRHSFATHLLEGGASVRDVQELLGHASVQTTQIYTRITVAALREVYWTAHPRARGGQAARGPDRHRARSSGTHTRAPN